MSFEKWKDNEILSGRKVTVEANHLCRKAYEYGYEEAKQEMQEIGLALQSDMDKTIEQNIQLKKQNNWLEGCKLELAEHLGKANDKISELEQQIEKMKCCGNCKYSAQETVYSIVCKVGGVNKGEIENVEDCLVCDKWEIKEND